MSWWTTALHDTCSLITLDKLLLESPDLSAHFPPGFLAIEESFTADQMRAETVGRMRGMATLQALPSPSDLAAVLKGARLSRALAAVDLLVYATAVHSRVALVTADKRLARAVHAKGLKVGNIAVILKELVVGRRLTQRACEELLLGLATRKDLILGIPNPTWDDLKDYRFPG
jgi:hypothetical protein